MKNSDNKKKSQNEQNTEMKAGKKPSGISKDKKIDTGMTGSNARKDRNLEKSGSMEE